MRARARLGVCERTCARVRAESEGCDTELQERACRCFASPSTFATTSGCATSSSSSTVCASAGHVCAGTGLAAATSARAATGLAPSTSAPGVGPLLPTWAPRTWRVAPPQRLLKLHALLRGDDRKRTDQFLVLSTARRNAWPHRRNELSDRNSAEHRRACCTRAWANKQAIKQDYEPASKQQTGLGLLRRPYLSLARCAPLSRRGQLSWPLQWVGALVCAACAALQRVAPLLQHIALALLSQQPEPIRISGEGPECPSPSACGRSSQSF